MSNEATITETCSCGARFTITAWAPSASTAASRWREEHHHGEAVWLETVPAPSDDRGGLAEGLARMFHETYERLAPDHGYETRRDSAVPWDDVPDANRGLMVAVADAIIAAGWRKS